MVVKLGADVLVSNLLPRLDLNTLEALRCTSRFLRDLVDTGVCWETKYRADFASDQWTPQPTNDSSLVSSWYNLYRQRSRAFLVLWNPDTPDQLAEFCVAGPLGACFETMAGSTASCWLLFDGKVGHLAMHSEIRGPRARNLSGGALFNQVDVLPESVDAGAFVDVGGNSMTAWALDYHGDLHSLNPCSRCCSFRLHFGFEDPHRIVGVRGLSMPNTGVAHIAGMGLAVFEATKPSLQELSSGGTHRCEAVRTVTWGLVPLSGPRSSPSASPGHEVLAFDAGFRTIIFITTAGEPYLYDVPVSSRISDHLLISPEPVHLDGAVALLVPGDCFVQVRAFETSFALVSEKGACVYYPAFRGDSAARLPHLLQGPAAVRDVTLHTGGAMLFTDSGVLQLSYRDEEGVWVITSDGIPDRLGKSIVRIHWGLKWLAAIVLPHDELVNARVIQSVVTIGARSMGREAALPSRVPVGVI